MRKNTSANATDTAPVDTAPVDTASESIPNIPLLHSAADIVLRGDDYKASGAAMTFVGLLGQMDTPLVAVVGDERHPFTLAEYAKPVVKADGKEDKKLRSAQMTAIMVDLFGQTGKDIPDALKAEFNRCYGGALFAHSVLLFADANLRLVEGTSKNGNQVVHLGGVPAWCVMPLYDDDGKKTDALIHAIEHFRSDAEDNGEEVDELVLIRKAENRGVTCNGKNAGVYGVPTPTTVQAIAMLKEKAAKFKLIDVKPRAARNGGGDSGDKLLEHANAIKTALAVFNNSEAESDAPPSKDFETAMDEVAERWAAYRIANPLSLLDV